MSSGRGAAPGPIVIEPAIDADRDAVRALISRAGLPLDGFGEVPSEILVARSRGEIVGTVCLERHGGHGLLRSAVVAPGHRNQGIGSRLVEAAEGRARQSGLIGVYLLTETASDFFSRRGYRVIGREDGPDPIRASVEWDTACGEAAVPMVLSESRSTPGT